MRPFGGGGGGVVLALFAAVGLAVSAVGCAKERHAVIPADAMMTAEGNGKITGTATSAGTVYVYDQNDDRLIYSGEVDARDVVTVDPGLDQVSVAGQIVQTKVLRKGHKHRIFFGRTPM